MTETTTTTTAKKLTTAACAKCDGTGRLDCFSHYANGACFDCGGSGRVTVEALTASETAKRRAGVGTSPASD